ncbi:MAG TPA: ATP-binding protein, partial [Solirubrobacteraceae bacterium]
MADLLEREGELAALRSAATAAASGHGGVVTVAAPAGGGKTLLLRAAERLAAGAGLTPLRATATELTRQVPFALAQELLEPALRDAPHLLSGRGSAAAPLFGVSSGDAAAAETVLALAWVISVLAEDAPLALLVDDAQWSDGGTLDLLTHIAARAGDEALLLVVGARPPADGGDEAVAARLGGVELTPAPLSSRAAGELLGARMGRKVAAAFAVA